MSEALDMSQLPESDLLAFYGALIAVASADGVIDEKEKSTIIKTMEDFSEQAREEIRQYMKAPPPLETALERLYSANDVLRFGLMFSLINMAWADGAFVIEEKQAIALAQDKLHITDQQREAIALFIESVKKIQAGTLDYNNVERIMNQAIAGVKAAGIPDAAIYLQ